MDAAAQKAATQEVEAGPTSGLEADAPMPKGPVRLRKILALALVAVAVLLGGVLAFSSSHTPTPPREPRSSTAAVVEEIFRAGADQPCLVMGMQNEYEAGEKETAICGSPSSCREPDIGT